MCILVFQNTLLAGVFQNKVIFLMSDLRKVYGQFQVLKRNKEQAMTRVTYSSLDKYNKSPYLQRVAQHLNKKTPLKRQMTPIVGSNEKAETIESHQDQKQQPYQPKHTNSHQLPKIGHLKHKEISSVSPFKTELDSPDNPLISEKPSIGTHSATLQITAAKKKKLEPLERIHKLHFVTKTKAGTTGKQTKINQDTAFVEGKLPFGLKLFCVCDGHGLNGHLVSAYIKSNLIKNLITLLKTKTEPPTLQQMKQLITTALSQTNQSLLSSQINTQLSGSTVIAIFIYQNKIISFNVGDSRALLARQVRAQAKKSEDQNNEEENQKRTKLQMFLSNRISSYEWKAVPLSNDQKPDRPDEKERILQFGGRVFAQTNQKGQALGPLRVWMKDQQMPGLAMTRSFGDKAGIKAGTNGEPEIMEFDLKEQDKFIVVASDGLWEYLQNEDVMGLTIPYYLKDDLQMAAERLIKISSEIWQKISLSRDDITVIVISLHSPSEEQK